MPELARLATLARTRETYSHNQRVHAEFRIIGILFGKSGINDIVDAVYRDTRFRNVGGNDDLARAGRCSFKDAGLHLGWKGGINGQDDELGYLRSERLDPLKEDFTSRVDLFLTREKEKNVAFGFHEVDLHDGDEGRFEIVGLWLFGVEDLDGEGPAGNGKDGASPEVLGKLFGVERCGCADEFEVRSALAGLCSLAMTWMTHSS